MEKITTSICHSMRKAEGPDKRWPLAIQITYNRDPRKLVIDVEHITGMEFKRLFSEGADEQLKRIREKAEKELARARAILDSLPVFDYAEFSRLFRRKAIVENRKTKLTQPTPQDPPNLYASVILPPENQSEIYAAETPAKAAIYSNRYETPNVFFAEVIEPFCTRFRNQYGGRKYPKIKSEIDFSSWGEVANWYGKEIATCEDEERAGTAINYFNSLISLLHFKPKLSFKDITPSFLRLYEKWMVDRGRSISTVGFYLRPLRTVINDAIDAGYIQERIYPFGRRRYIIPASENKKKAISTEGLKKLYYSVPLCWQERFYRDLAFFIYFGNGLNPKDVSLLKYCNIKGDFIHFYRAKNMRTAKGKRRVVKIYLNPDLRRIMAEWANKDTHPDNYIFPILTPGLSFYERRDLVQLFIRRFNFWMGVIAKREGVSEQVLTMSLRHSCATQLLYANVNREFIREILGQVDPGSIDNYLASFPEETHKRHVAHLEAFKMAKDVNQLGGAEIEELMKQILNFLTKKQTSHVQQ